jgi:hypothetical protein
MRKEKEYKITFKKGKRETGLSAVCSGISSTEIKYWGMLLGYIDFNTSWNSMGKGIKVKFRKKDKSRKWVWVTLKDVFKTEDEAREKVQLLKTQILANAYFDECDKGND